MMAETTQHIFKVRCTRSHRTVPRIDGPCNMKMIMEGATHRILYLEALCLSKIQTHKSCYMQHQECSCHKNAQHKQAHVMLAAHSCRAPRQRVGGSNPLLWVALIASTQVLRHRRNNHPNW
jgi:hypothetical protein